MKITNYLIFVVILVLSIFSSSYAALSVSFILDLDPPIAVAGGYFPPPDTVVNETTVTINVEVIDYGAGVWTDYSTSSSEWGDTVGSYLTWSVNDGAFTDTVWDTFGCTWTFNNLDSVTVCINAIDEIHNYGCSCPPNLLRRCWSFVCCVPNLQPEIWDVSFAQTTDGSQLVDISYYANDENSDSIEITIEVSDDGGLTWDLVFPTTFITPSDIGWVEASPTEVRHIIWDMGMDMPECFFEESDIVIRVWGDDGRYYRCE